MIMSFLEEQDSDEREDDLDESKVVGRDKKEEVRNNEYPNGGRNDEEDEALEEV
jgi:hypothetical protein